MNNENLERVNNIKMGKGLYDPSFEHDNCGIGAIVNIHGKKSHQIVDDALKIVENLEHRAGKDAEGKTGDGVGILTQIPHKFLKKECDKLGFDIGNERNYGVGMFFFPEKELLRSQAMKMFEVIVQKEGLSFIGWAILGTLTFGILYIWLFPYMQLTFTKFYLNILGEN